MSLVEHAEFEMRCAGLFDKDSDYGGMIGEAVMRLVRVHAAEGHSGFSHGLVVDVFNRVINYKTLSPLTAAPDEWMLVADDMWQSRRDPAVFSADGGLTAYHVETREPVAIQAVPDDQPPPTAGG